MVKKNRNKKESGGTKTAAVATSKEAPARKARNNSKVKTPTVKGKNNINNRSGGSKGKGNSINKKGALGKKPIKGGKGKSASAPRKPLTAEQLDKQMDDYMMRNEKTAEKILEDQMDEYWAQKGKSTNDDDNEQQQDDEEGAE